MERGMAARNGQRSLRGSMLTAMGVAVLFADLAFLMVPLTRIAEKASDGLIGIVPTIGMSILHVVRAIEFHQVDYFSLIARILVLFSAMVAVIVGLALWRTRSGGEVASDQTTLSAIRKKDIQ